MKIDGKHPPEGQPIDMLEDNVNTLPMPTDIIVDDQRPSQHSLIQQFGDFDFLLTLQPVESLKIDQVQDDLQSYHDHFLNENIRSILTFASVLTEPAEFDRLLQLMRLLLRRKFAAQSELVVLVKCCFLFRKLIEVTARYPPDRRMSLYRQILDSNHNHYHSGFRAEQIIQVAETVQSRLNSRQGFQIEEPYPFSGGVRGHPHDRPLQQIYVGGLLQVGILELLRDQFPASLDVFADIQKFIDQELVEAVLPIKEVIQRVGNYLLAVPNESQAVTRQQIEHMLKSTEQLCNDSPNEKRKRITEMELNTASCFLKSPSMDKKLWALSLINDKIRLLGMGEKEAGVELIAFLDWLENCRIYQSLIQQNVHPEVMGRSTQLVRFLYEKERLSITDIEDLVQFTIRSESDSINKLAHCLIVRLEYKHLERVFDLVVEITTESKHLNASSIKILESIINAQVLNQNERKNKRKRTHSGAKEERKDKTSGQEKLEELKPTMEVVEAEPPKNTPSPLVSKLFTFVMAHLNEYPLIHLVSKLISAEPLVFSMVPQELVNAIREDRPNSIALLDSIIKLQFPIGREKGMWTKEQFVTWLANESIFEYLLVGIARNRFDKSLNERLSLLALLGKYYKPFEKSLVEQLWRILGMRAIDDRHREQFFLFVRDCLIKGNNEPLFTEEAVNFVYFGILLKLHARWFSLKIYDCFEMFFLRFNQDCKLLGYLNSSTTNYQLLDPQLIGLNKFWYIYLTGEDSKVVKRCKDFLTRLLSKYECEQKVFLVMKQEYVSLILEHINNNLEAVKSKEVTGEERTRRLQLLARCLEMLIRVIEELEGKRLSGDKPPPEEITIHIENAMKDKMPPRTLPMKVDVNLTLKQLKELVGKSINPPKKGTQLKLMTRGAFLRGQNLNLKEMKIDNKQHLTVDAVEDQEQSPQKLDERLFEDMKQMFPNHSEQLIRHVLYKRHGEDEQTIAEALLDDEAVARYNEELHQPATSKMVSELLSSTQNIFETFFEVLNVQDPELSLLTWRIISNIPDNPYHTELVRQTILKTNDWNEIVASGENCFKTLYNLQLLRGMLADPKGEEQQLKHKFVENGGFDHLYQTARQLMQSWRGDPLEAKLLTSLLQVVKLYVKPHLQSLVNKPLVCIFKEVINYRSHLKDIAQDSIGHIIDEIVTPENNTVGSREKSFSFKMKSSSSRQTPTNQTPNFQSLNPSRSNSPHSQRPNDKDEDNMSSLSGSKTSNLKHADSKHSGSVKQDSFSKKMQEALNLNLQLHHFVNVQELAMLLLGDVAVVARGQAPADNEDISSLVEQLFDLLLPSLLVTSAYDTVLSQHEGVKAVVQGLATSPNEQFRLRLVYTVFLLCAVSDILNENRIMVEDDDQLFMTTNTQRQGPKIYFIQQLLPLFQANPNLHESYFICLTKLLKEIDTQQMEQLMTPHILLKQAVEGVLTRPVIEQHDSETQDSTLNGLLALIQVLLERYKPLKKQYPGLICELFGFLFHLPQSPEQFQNIKNYPKCKKKSTRRRCLSLLAELVRDSPQPRQQLLELIIKCCENLSPKEFESTVMRTERYPGLRNLGATCYINSLLQQLHKNTLLGPMLCNKDIIQLQHHQPLFQLARLMSSLTHSLKSTIHPGEFIKCVKFHGGETINPLVQQDVNEFFMAFVDLLEKNSAQPLLNATLCGQICNELTGQDDLRKFVKKGIEQFYTISLDIKGKRSLQEALQQYIKADILDGDNMYFSDELNKKVRAIKRSYIRRLPNTLVFTLKRFQFDYNTMLRSKLNDYLEFPMQLDMLRFSEQHLSEQAENIYDEGYYKYRLVGVLVHAGTAESGHYYSYIRDGEKWWEFNDSAVSEFNITNLKTETFGGEQSPNRGANDWEAASSKSRNAYLLFYQRVHPLDNQLNVLVKDHQIKGQFMDLVWRENLQFLRSRLVFDSDFLRFLEDIYEMGKDQSLADVLSRLQQGRRRQKQQTKPDDLQPTQAQIMPPITNPDIDAQQQQPYLLEGTFWNKDEARGEEEGLLNQLGQQDKMEHPNF